jgi:hypothetical protein
LMARRRRLAARLQHSGGGRWRRWGARARRWRWRGIFSVSGRGGVQVQHLKNTTAFHETHRYQMAAFFDAKRRICKLINGTFFLFKEKTKWGFFGFIFMYDI